MKITFLEEPLLQFGYGQGICPKDGITKFHPYDLEMVRPEKIKTALIGRADSLDTILKWIEGCRSSIPGKVSKNPKPNLFPRFPGFNQNLAFKSEISYDDSYIRKINNSDFEEALKEKGSLDDRIEKMVELYLAEIKFLAKNKNPDVILCVLSEKFMEEITLAELPSVEDPEEDREPEEGEEEEYLESNFRRLLKARAMQYNIPIQIVRDRIVGSKAGIQDQATIGWNFYTALYYKAGGTPWALIKNQDFDTCYAGISFYRSRDRQTIQTSVAQIFNERGKGVILRGEQVEMKKFDRTPHLSDEQAFRLLDNSLQEYWDAIKIFPKRLVLHKTSNYSEAEIGGFQAAARKRNIHAVDMVTIHERTDLRLYREQDYPPRRGVMMTMDEKNYLLYTRGAVEFYETYTGKYIPHPLQVRLFKYDENPELINREILALTKMNWNNTQFDRRFPITIECSRNVGEILKYLRPDDNVQIKYGFYM